MIKITSEALLSWGTVIITLIFGIMAICINFCKGKEQKEIETTQETPEKIKKRQRKERRKKIKLSNTSHHKNDTRKVWGAFGKRGI